MALRASPKAGRKKVRCPKCTALFSEPAKAVFDCPICSCHLSANGAIVSMEIPTKEGDSGQRKAVLGSDEPIKMQSPMDFVKKEGSSSNGNGMTQEEKAIDCEQDMASHTQIHKKREQQSITESPRVFANGDTDGRPSVGSSIEGVYGKDGIVGPHLPMHSVSEPGNLVSRKERGESLLRLVAGANEEAALVITTGQRSSNDASKENSLMVREESNLIAAGDEGIEKDCVMNGVSSNRRLQSQIFRTTRCEFSFKYSLEGASPFESDGDLLHRKRSPNSKIVSSEATMPETEASDMPLHTPLRVRISKAHEESSDQSEHGRQSFGSETDSDDGLGSDFDFPAPWAEGLQDIVLPTSFGQNDVLHPNSKTIVSAAPHQLELQDVYDTIDHEESTLQQESRKHLKVPEAELSSQVENAGKTIERESELRDEESSRGLVQPVFANEKNHVSLGPPDRETAISELKPLSSHTQSLDVSDLASHVSSVMLNDNLDVVGNNAVPFMEDSTQKLGGSGSEECSDGGEEQEAFEPLDVVVPPDGGQVLKMNGQCNGKQESINVEKKDPKSSLSISDADLTNSATLPNQEYLETKQSASNLDHTDCSDETRSISNTGGFQMVDLRETYKNGSSHNHQKMMPSGAIKDELSSDLEGLLADSLLSSMSKIEQSNDVANARGHVSSHMENAELEHDLYKLPYQVYGNDSVLGESSHSALWAEETCVSALSDSTFVNTSKARLYHEKKNPHKSSHGKPYGNSGSRLKRSDNGEDHFMSGPERNLRGPARETSLQATSGQADWEGHITAAADKSGHPDLHEMERKPGAYSQYPVNNSLGFSLANSQPYALTSQIYPYQLHPAAFQNHALSHCGYHAMSPACILCSYHQHPHMQPQHIPHCGVCFSQSGSTIAYNSGLIEHWNCHQAHHGSASSCAGSLVDYPLACSSTNLIQRQDFPNVESRSQASSTRKATLYPPFPKSGAAPYVTCKGCSRVLQVPSDLPSNDGTIQKLRCGACGKVTKFSVNYCDQQRRVVSSTLLPELDSIGGVTNMLPSVQYGTHIRQLPVSSAIESIEPSYKHDMLKVNPVPHWSNEVSPQANNIAASRTSEQNPQGGEFFRVQPRSPAMDASRNTYGQHDPSISVSTIGPSHLQNVSSLVGVMSPRNAALRSTDSFGFERSKVNPAASFHLTVDEKEEGLDFGAPRISDGDSLDHSESRMRSPEYYQACNETTHISQAGPSRGHQPSEQVSDWSEDHGMAAQDKKPGSPLLVLLNQESTRFRLNLEPRVTFEGSGSAVWSPASDSSLYANSLHDRPQKREQDNPPSHGTTGQHFVSKGPKYIAGLLRRSLRDFGRGGQ